MGIIRMGDCCTSTQLLLTAAAVGIGTANYAPTAGAAKGLIAREALIGLETNDARWHSCGATPAANCGMIMVKGDYLVLNSPYDIQKFLAVNTGGGSSTMVIFLSF